EVPVEDEILAALPAEGSDPEIEHFKRLYAAEFRAALSEAIAGLASRERNLLRHGFADALSIDQIGALYGVHRSTAARWIHAARALDPRRPAEAPRAPAPRAPRSLARERSGAREHRAPHREPHRHQPPPMLVQRRLKPAPGTLRTRACRSRVRPTTCRRRGPA